MIWRFWGCCDLVSAGLTMTLVFCWVFCWVLWVCVWFIVQLLAAGWFAGFDFGCWVFVLPGLVVYD